MSIQSIVPATVLLAVVTGIGGAYQLSPSVVPNGSFEEGMTGWKSSMQDPAQAGLGMSIDETHHRDGSRSAQLSLPKHGGVTLTSERFPVEGGRDYLCVLYTRSEGFSRTGSYDGVNAQYLIDWFDAEGKNMGRVGSGFSYAARPNWEGEIRVVSAPASAASAGFTFPVSAQEGKLPSVFWIDAVSLRPWELDAKQGGKSWTFSISDGYFSQSTFRRVADDTTPSGFAVIANPRFINKKVYMAGGIYFRGFPPGAYRALYKLKIGEKPEGKLVVSLDINPQMGGNINASIILSDQFEKPRVYQDIPLRFVVGPNAGYVDFRVFWQGEVTTWVDTVTIVEEEVFGENEIQALFE